MAQKAGWGVMASHRSGETEDSFIADLLWDLQQDRSRLVHLADLSVLQNTTSYFVLKKNLEIRHIM
jgi:hypothetical protein